MKLLLWMKVNCHPTGNTHISDYSISYKMLGGDSLLFHTFHSQEEGKAFGGSISSSSNIADCPLTQPLSKSFLLIRFILGVMIPCTSTAMMTINFLLTMIPFFPMEFTATEKPELLICAESIITLSKKPTASSNHFKRNSFQSRKF